MAHLLLGVILTKKISVKFENTPACSVLLTFRQHVLYTSLILLQNIARSYSSPGLLNIFHVDLAQCDEIVCKASKLMIRNSVYKRLADTRLVSLASVCCCRHSRLPAWTTASITDPPAASSNSFINSSGTRKCKLCARQIKLSLEYVRL